MSKFIRWFEEISIEDIPLVGGKNASLGEMLRNLGKRGIRVPSGFVVTAEAYRLFLREAGLEPFIKMALRSLRKSDVKHFGQVGSAIRKKIENAKFSPALETQIVQMFRSQLPILSSRL